MGVDGDTAVRTYLTKNKIKNVAFFCTFDGSVGKTFEEMENASKKPISVLPISVKEDYSKKIKEFCKSLL